MRPFFMPTCQFQRPDAKTEPTRTSPRLVFFAAAAAFLLASLPSGTEALGQPTTETRLQIVQAAAGPADLRLTGPVAGAVGQSVVVTVSGLPAVDLSATVGEQTKWIDSIRFEVSSPDAKPVSLDKELSMSVSPWEWRLRLTLTPPSAGTYVVVCDWNQEPFGLALHRVTIGGDIPTPPGPPDPPTPPGTNPYPPPAAELKATLVPVVKIKTSRADSIALGKLYDSASRLVASAPAAKAAGVKPEIGTTSELREWLVREGKILGLQGRYAGLADAVDRFLGQRLGTAIRDVTEADAGILSALAWATWEGGR